jgi:hypothetical protein
MEHHISAVTLAAFEAFLARETRWSYLYILPY